MRNHPTLDIDNMEAVVGRRLRFDFKQVLSRRHSLLLGSIGGAQCLSLWQVGAMMYAHPQLWPPPTAVSVALCRLFAEQDFLHDVGASCVRIALSFGLAASIALPLGLVMGTFTPIRALWGPVVAASRYLLVTAFVPLFLMWLGAGAAQKIALLTIGVLFFLITLIIDETLAVQDKLIDTARTRGASRRQILRTVVVPASLPT